MLEYHFETMEYANRKTNLIIVMEHSYQQLVARFLMSDVQSKPAEGYLEEIDQVLMDEKNRTEFSGNVCTVVVLKELSTIYNDLDDDAAPCKVATEALRQIIIDWCNAKEAFRESQNNDLL